MPYKTNADLPQSVRDSLPEDAQTIWRDAYTVAEGKWPGVANEGRRASYAWGAVKQAGFEKGKDGKWHKRRESGAESAQTIRVFGLTLIQGEPFKRDLCSDDVRELSPIRCVEDARHNPANGDYHIVILSAGVNEKKRRVYPNATVENISLELYRGRKMYLDHDVEDGASGGVRSVRDLAAIVQDPWLVKSSESADGTAELHAIAHVFPDVPGFSENMRDVAYRQQVAVSHVFGYKGYLAREAETGKTWEVITEITAVDSVDWVTEPGARGRVVESQTKGANEVTLEELTVDALRTARPDLVQEIADGAVTAYRARESDAAQDTQLQSNLAAEKAAREAAEAKLRSIEIDAVTNSVVAAEGSGIPDVARSAVASRISERVKRLPPDQTDGDKLTAVVKTELDKETAFIKTLIQKPEVSVTTGQRDDGADSAAQNGEAIVRSFLR